MSSSLYLIDASVYVFRGYYSVNPELTDQRGEPANAVFGYGMFLCELLEKRRPGHVAVAFDESLSTSFRNEFFTGYKANRPPAPADLKHQFEVCRALTSALGVPAFASRRYEADDLIGSLAERFRSDALNAVYVTADKDLAQLIEGDDRLWDAARNRWLNTDGVVDTFGVRPDQIADLLGLAGDSVDNIPGIPGIGRKTAVTLLAALADIDGIYADLDAVYQLGLRGASRVRRLLEQHREQALLSRRLATIKRDVPLSCRLTDLAWTGADRAALEDLPLPGALKRRALRLAADFAEAG